MSLSVVPPLPCDPPPVGLLCPVFGPRLTGVADHSDRLPEICHYAHPVKEGYQGGKGALEPGGVQRDDHSLIGI